MRAIVGQILNAGRAKQVAAPAQLVIEPFQDAHAEFALAFDGNDARMRQPVGGVRLELDALFEVDQVEFDLVGTVNQCRICD